MASQDWFEKDFYKILGVAKDVSDSAMPNSAKNMTRFAPWAAVLALPAVPVGLAVLGSLAVSAVLLVALASRMSSPTYLVVAVVAASVALARSAAQT
ncbi:MAG: hypothetical protein RI974_733 [Actinomycetota bacterium]